MEATITDLLDLIVRWTHVIAGIMWIGNSLLFNWLDRNLMPKEGIDGEIWLLHSGGFYEIEKKQLEPSQMPAQLHWFKWQNFTTWVSGIMLLIIVYYLGGAAYMVDPGPESISFSTAILVGAGAIVVSWLVYDLLWRSPLGQQTALAFAISLALLVGLTYGLSRLLNGRAAYIHIGAILGTLMTGNVWLHIMPSQRALVAATKAGQRQDRALANRAKQRSIHNNYMTFPVIFTMISHHFPETYGSSLNWLILTVIMVAGAAVRHFMNIRFSYGGWLRAILATGIISITLLVLLTARGRPGDAPSTAQTASFQDVQGVIGQRCLSCHSTAPTDNVFTTAPAGVIFDTPEQIKARAAQINAQAVVTRAMPLGNKTGMTDEERALLSRWIEQGAAIDR